MAKSHEAYLLRMLRQTNYIIRYRGHRRIVGPPRGVGHAKTTRRIQRMGVERYSSPYVTGGREVLIFR